MKPGDTLKRIDAQISQFKYEALAGLLIQCTRRQRKQFNTLYGVTSPYQVTKDKINNAIELCERTVIQNEKFPERMKEEGLVETDRE